MWNEGLLHGMLPPEVKTALVGQGVDRFVGGVGLAGDGVGLVDPVGSRGCVQQLLVKLEL